MFDEQRMKVIYLSFASNSSNDFSQKLLYTEYNYNL